MAGFMAGFGTTLSNLIEEDRKYYRDAAAKRREYIQTYGTRAIVDRENQANAALSVANTLMDRGFSKDYVTSVAANSGVLALGDLAKRIESRSDLTKEDIAEIEASAKDFVKANPDQDLDTVIKRAYGLYRGGRDPVERKTNLFGAMLGLDSRTMEDDVLNEMYLNGYTGKDIYRIMGSSGPKPGKPLGITLPPKALSLREQGYAFTNIIDPQFESSLKLDMQMQQAIMKDPNADVASIRVATALNDQLIEIEKLYKKDKGGAIAAYISSPDFNNAPVFTTFLQGVEANTPGSVLRNSILGIGFQQTFKQLIGDAQDDAAESPMGDEEQVRTIKPTTTPVKGAGTTPPKTSVVTHKAADEAEALELLQSGVVKVGDSIDVNGTIRPVTKLPEGVTPKLATEPNYADRMGVAPIVRTASRLLDGKDGKLQGYEELYTTMMELPEDERSEYAEMVMALEEEASLADAWDVIKEEAPGATDWAVGKVYGGSIWALGAFSEGLARAYSRMGLSTSTAAKQVLRSRENRETAKEIMADGIVQHLQGIADEAGVTGAWGPGRAAAIKAKLAKSPALDPAIQKLAEMEERIRDNDRQFIADARSFPQPLKTIVIEPSEETEAEPRKAGRIMPTPDDSMDDKARRGTGRRALTEPGSSRKGIMSRDAVAEVAPKVGSDEFEALAKRVYGSNPDVNTDLVDKLGTTEMKYGDLLNLIRSTERLPKTKSRDTLLQSLYDLSDAIRNR